MPATFRNIASHFRHAGLMVKTGYLLSVLLVAFLAVKGLSPLPALRSLEKMAKADSLFVSSYEEAFNNPEVIPLIRERSYKEALLQLSENDSIGLIINLVDSVVGLAVHGVIINEVHMTRQRIDPFLKRLPNQIYTALFSRPVPVFRERASIVKEPIVVREAPKDTTEAMLNAYMPDTLIQKPAFVLIQLDHHINLILEQDSNPAIKDKAVKTAFLAGLHVRRWLNDFTACFTLKMPEYHPDITIKIPADDLRAVFRALPDEAQVVVYYE